MTVAVERFKHQLKTAGQSITAPRLAVFETLLGQEPLSMRQLADRVKQVDRASVYRAVSLFERLGVVQRLYSGWKYKIELSDAFSDHHHHLTCTHCGLTITLHDTELETLIASVIKNHGFTPISHQLEVQGLCAQCHLHQP